MVSTNFLDLPDELKCDIEQLEQLLHEVIEEQAGKSLVDKLISCSKQSSQLHQLEFQFNELSYGKLKQFVRSTSLYFILFNLLEQIHRIRRKYAYQQQEKTQPESLLATVKQLQENGVTVEQLLANFTSTGIHLVFTAHPTEARRRLNLARDQRIARKFLQQLHVKLTPQQQKSLLDELKMEITQLWQTEEHPLDRPRVRDERQQVLYYFHDVIYGILPSYYEAIREAILANYGEKLALSQLPAIITFGSWVGGDMDGNPNVTSKTVMAALEDHRSILFQCYQANLTKLMDWLTQSSELVEISREVDDLIKEYSHQFPNHYKKINLRHRNMSYRVLLILMKAKLEATKRRSKNNYKTADEFIADLQVIENSLQVHSGKCSGMNTIVRLILRVKTFAFHLAALDIRQDGRQHQEVMAMLLDDKKWCHKNSLTRVSDLEQLFYAEQQPHICNHLTRETLEVFKIITIAKKRFSKQAIGLFIVSMTQGADDILTVLQLAKWGGLQQSSGDIDLDIAPLFETIEDLVAAPAIMEQLLTSHVYRKHLKQRDNHQYIMLGYSDSSKDGGIVASRWLLLQAQHKLVEACNNLQVKVTFFHGVGGSTSRGGGKLSSLIKSTPIIATNRYFHITEQGEVINRKFGLRTIALRYFEQMTHAICLVGKTQQRVKQPEQLTNEIMSVFSSVSQQSFQSLVYGDNNFHNYFRQVTPIDVLENMKIGSRPHHRGKITTIESLRAIPWVFSWIQNRQLLTAWYGVGAGLEAIINKYGEQNIIACAQRFSFFGNLLAEIEIALGKTELVIAKHYLELADQRFCHELFETIAAEYQLAVELLLLVRQQERLLQYKPTLHALIQTRNPSINPLNILQVKLLKQWRDGDRKDKDLLKLLINTVNGIALGMQNTG